MKMLLVFNPGSRGGKSSKMREQWEHGLARLGADYLLAETKSLGHASELARNPPADCDAVVAVGGDGTINEVLNGVAQSGRDKLAFGVLYSGTSPDFCLFHKIPLEPEKSIAALVSGKSALIDIARISFRSLDGKELVSHFGCSCNIGMGAQIASFSNRVRPFIGDTAGTLAAALRAFAKCRPFDMELELDGMLHHLEKVNNITILKNNFIASGLKVNVESKPDDGKLHVLAVSGKNRLGLLKALPGFYTGNVASAKGVFLKACSKVTINPVEAQELEFDGDPRGFAPATIEILPGKIRLLGGGYG